MRNGVCLLALAWCVLSFYIRFRNSSVLKYPVVYPSVSTDPLAIVDPIFSKSLLRTSGKRWRINPGSENLLATRMQKYTCKWIDFISTTGEMAKFCGHVNRDFITQHIEQQGHWRDCNILPKLWNDTTRHENSIYVEIGANIGSCVMEMLLSTDAKVIAFEPHPHNQFALQKSIEALPKSYQERFVLVPVALGAMEASNIIYAGEGNMGNSVVGQKVKDWGGQNFSEAEEHQIAVESISTIIGSYPDIALMKMDAQGFECQILRGLEQNLANKIQMVKFEVANKWLRAQGCHNLFGSFRNLGFEITGLDKIKLEGEANQFSGIRDMYATRVA